MKTGRLLAVIIVVATVVLIIIGTVWPSKTALAMMVGTKATTVHRPTSPMAAAEILLAAVFLFGIWQIRSGNPALLEGVPWARFSR